MKKLLISLSLLGCVAQAQASGYGEYDLLHPSSTVDATIEMVGSSTETYAAECSSLLAVVSSLYKVDSVKDAQKEQLYLDYSIGFFRFAVDILSNKLEAQGVSVDSNQLLNETTKAITRMSDRYKAKLDEAIISKSSVGKLTRNMIETSNGCISVANKLR